MTFRTLANDWQADVLPMYKHSTQKNHRHISEKHLVPRFGDTAISDVTRQDVQAYVAHLTQAGYAPKTIDHIHDVLSAVLRTAVKWGHLQENPARGVDLPTLKTVRPKWALTIGASGGAARRAAAAAADDGRAGDADGTPARRTVRAAVEGRRLSRAHLTVREAVYEGSFGTPKTEAGLRPIPLSDAALAAARRTWQAARETAEPDALVFSTWSGKPISPNNVPAAMDLPGLRGAWAAASRRGSRFGGPTHRGRTTRACRARSSRS